MPNPIKDISGNKYNSLTAIQFVGVGKSKNAIWRCQCECGNVIDVYAYNLKNGATKSCGCIKSKTSRKNFLKAAGVSQTNNALGTMFGTRASQLRDGPYITNKTGVRGVSLRNGIYIAHISFKGKSYHLGSFHILDDAKTVRREAEQRIWGDFLDWYNNEYRKEKYGRIAET